MRVFGRRGTRATLLGTLLAGACTRFAASDGPSPGTGDGGPDASPGVAVADAASEADAEIASMRFIGSRTTTAAAPPLSVLSPPGVRPDDVLVGVWTAGQQSNDLPLRWTEQGRTTVFDCCFTPVVVFLGYHVVASDESDATSYAFTSADGPSAISLVAFRNARTNQPLAPVIISTLALAPGDAGAAVLDADPFQARGTTVPLLALGSVREATFPNLDGYTRAEATGTVALYFALQSSPSGATVALPPVVFSSAPATTLGVGWFGIVAASP
jgi:hypothetical protein